MSAAIGMIEVEGVAGIILASDAACKAAGVDLLGWESIGGFTTVFLGGSVSRVATALKSGEEAAREVAGHVVAAPMTHPEPACREYVSNAIAAHRQTPSGALGLIETRGYGAHVTANDKMVKAAAVRVYNVLTVHNRVVCSLILGDVASVTEALPAGRASVERGGHFLGDALIPKPLPDVLRAFGP
ncbi:MAG: BMC domain-containing protein [Gemmatimonadota bacterium]|nr:BMC domain-containing protein [Gemmatimonadota bacterium]